MRHIKQVGVYVNFEKKFALESVKVASDLLLKRGFKVLVRDKDPINIDGVEKVSSDILREKADLIITFGGDGTMLSAVHFLKGKTTPILGINLGGLGFLTSTTKDEIDFAIDCITKEDFYVSARTMINVRVINGKEEKFNGVALNDVVLEHYGTSRIVNLLMQIDGQNITTYACDGIIISTPTGSTGHSLSAGGPVVHPECPAFIISLICAHTLSVRPLVLSDSHKISIFITKSHSNLLLSVDGQLTTQVAVGDSVEIVKSEYLANLVYMKGYSYFDVLREKLHWRGSALV